MKTFEVHQENLTYVRHNLLWLPENYRHLDELDHGVRHAFYAPAVRTRSETMPFRCAIGTLTDYTKTGNVWHFVFELESDGTLEPTDPTDTSLVDELLAKLADQ